MAKLVCQRRSGLRHTFGIHRGTEGKKVRPRAASHSCFASSSLFFHPKCPESQMPIYQVTSS
jgi:hypothetical protein